MSSQKRTRGKDSTDTSTATIEPPAAEADVSDQGFAERVGPKKPLPVPDPFGIATDYLAGVHLSESKADRLIAIQFGEGRPEDRPSQDVIDTMKGAGYRWNPSARLWTHPVRPESARITRIEAERLYEDVCQMIRQEKGIEAGPEISR